MYFSTVEKPRRYGTRGFVGALAVALASVAAAGLGWQASAQAGDIAISPTEFTALMQDLSLGNQPWTKIPWMTSVTAARLRAAHEQKPIFMIVNTGNCLGFV